MKNMHRIWAEIDLDAIAHNVREIRRRLKPETRLMGVVKADAYGHGVMETAKTILENGADSLAVACIDEAVQLRRQGIDVPILVLGASDRETCEDFVKYDIMPSVFDAETAEHFSEIAESIGKIVSVHVKIDTGMSRIGFLYDGNGENRRRTECEIVKISQLPSLKIDGMFTHFASADEEDGGYTQMQYERLTGLAERLSAQGIDIPTKHAGNSAAIMKFPEMQLDMVRAGIIMYGMYPSDEVDRGLLPLRPAMKFKARVIHVKEVDCGTCVSYGRTFRTERKTKIATVAAGYADGYTRMLSGKTEVIVDGVLAKQIGRICMDQCMIDVTDVNNISVGDEVILFGSDGKCSIPIESIAEKIGTINYEISCMVSRRVPRIYIKDGRIEESVNYLLEGCDL